MKKQAIWLRGFLVTPALCAAVAGCSKENPETAAPDKPEPMGRVKEGVKAVTEDASANADVLAKLARADEADGKLDKVVSKCPSCALRMDGQSKYSLTFAGFTLHFCSEDCRKGFETDTTRKILALKIVGK